MIIHLSKLISMYKKDLLEKIVSYGNILNSETEHLSVQFAHNHLRKRRVSLKTHKTLA